MAASSAGGPGRSCAASCSRERSPLQLSDARSSDRPRAVAGLSGGVDSAVAALLALRAGWSVTGVTLLTPGAVPEQARAVCRDLGIEHRAVDAREPFERCVIGEFVEAWARGLTPNPCVECNPRVKFDLLAREADALGASALITGHYARVRRAGDRWHLLRGLDPSRDQSYMLYRLSQAVLGRLLLPLGDLDKDLVRGLAAEAGVSAAERPDSQDICFAPEDGAVALIAARRPEALRPGPILDAEGREIGRHRGLARYTVGQRRGLGIGGPEGPFFVLRIDPARNALVVGSEEDLWVDRVRVERVHFVGEVPAGPFDATVMTRYRGRETPATIVRDGDGVTSARDGDDATDAGEGHLETNTGEGDGATILFHRPHRAPAPGQSAVFYAGERCLGGGVIA